jgi:hypothetical protein
VIPAEPPFEPDEVIYRATPRAAVSVTDFEGAPAWPPGGLSCDRGAFTHGAEDCIQRRRAIGRKEAWVAITTVSAIELAEARYVARNRDERRLGFCIVYAPVDATETDCPNPAHSEVYAVKPDDIARRRDADFEPTRNWGGDSHEIARSARQAIAKVFSEHDPVGPFDANGHLARSDAS